jgi:hypothetical protein
MTVVMTLYRSESFARRSGPLAGCEYRMTHPTDGANRLIHRVSDTVRIRYIGADSEQSVAAAPSKTLHQCS